MHWHEARFFEPNQLLLPPQKHRHNWWKIAEGLKGKQQLVWIERGGWDDRIRNSKSKETRIIVGIEMSGFKGHISFQTNETILIFPSHA